MSYYSRNLVSASTLTCILCTVSKLLTNWPPSLRIDTQKVVLHSLSFRSSWAYPPLVSWRRASSLIHTRNYLYGILYFTNFGQKLWLATFQISVSLLDWTHIQLHVRPLPVHISNSVFLAFANSLLLPLFPTATRYPLLYRCCRRFHGCGQRWQIIVSGGDYATAASHKDDRVRLCRELQKVGLITVLSSRRHESNIY